MENKLEYAQSYYNENYKNFLDNEDFYILKSKLAIRKYLREDIEVLDALNILDYGCGIGQNIYLLKNAKGYDISKFAVDYCMERGIYATNNLGDIKDNSMDIVLCAHVLEHTKYPLNELINIYNKLKTGGRLILILPAETHFKADFNMDFTQHLYCFNFRCLNNLLITAGFNVIENKFFRRGGEFKLRSIANINFGLYLFLTKLIGLLNYFKFKYTEIMVVAIK